MKKLREYVDRQKKNIKCMKSIDDIGRLFDELLQFQFVKSSKKDLSYLDEEKYLEKDKDS